MTFDIINPKSLREPRGWNNGMLAPAGGRLLFVAGQVGWDATGKVVGAGFVQQFTRALENVLAVVHEAGGRPDDVARLTIYVSDLEAYIRSRKALGVSYRQLMGRHYPAMTLVEVKALLEEGALVEIEATAVIP